ncbi:hypothetical protein [Embleya sp. NPDC020886]|uniref:hypothetical protein n=1 Tax=Embleya sp. NPDC020886 TaxID=3363980 RepID=UPI0037A45E5C
MLVEHGFVVDRVDVLDAPGRTAPSRALLALDFTTDPHEHHGPLMTYACGTGVDGWGDTAGSFIPLTQLVETITPRGHQSGNHP